MVDIGHRPRRGRSAASAADCKGYGFPHFGEIEQSFERVPADKILAVAHTLLQMMLAETKAKNPKVAATVAKHGPFLLSPEFVEDLVKDFAKGGDK
jgi:hypothetical protein